MNLCQTCFGEAPEFRVTYTDDPWTRDVCGECAASHLLGALLVQAPDRTSPFRIEELSR